MRKSAAIGLAAKLALLLSANLVPAQEDHRLHRPGLGAVIDGSNNPQLIPDAVAWRLYLRAVSEPADATPEQLKALRAKLSPLELSEADFEVCRGVLAAFKSEFELVEERIQAIGRVAPGSAAYSEVISLRKAMERVVFDTRASLEARLSPEGAAKLRRHVLDAKRDMKAVPVIQPPSKRPLEKGGHE